MKASKLDPPQIIKQEHDEVSKAKRVKIIDTELAIAVSAEDGDSVQTLPRAALLDLSAGQEVDCLWVREIAVEGPEGLKIEITIDGSKWHDLGDIICCKPIYITATKLRCSKDCNIILRS